MIGSVSHGIKGLITGLDGGIYLVDSGFKHENNEMIREGWDVVKIMTARIRKLMQDILYYAKKRDLQIEPVEIIPFVEELGLVVGQRAQKHDIKLIKTYNLNDLHLEGDPEYLHSALLNILDNAIDACLRDDAKVRHEIEINVSQDLKYIIFYIKDNGVGMTRETKKKIYSLFYSTKGKKGTGLGLFISNSIIQQHNGHIHCESEPGKGTAFKIRIPVKADPDFKSRYS